MGKILFLTRNRSSRGGHMIIFELIEQIKKQGLKAELVTFETQESIDKTKDLELWKDKEFKSILIKSDKNKDQERLNYINQVGNYVIQECDNSDKIILDSWYNVLAAIRSKRLNTNVFHLALGDPDNQHSDDFWKNMLFDTIPYFPINRIAISGSSGQILNDRYGIKTQVMTTYVNEVFHKTFFTITDKDTIGLVSSAADFNPPEKGLEFLLKSLNVLSGKHKLKLTLITLEPIKQDLSNFNFPINVVRANTPNEVSNELVKHDIFVNTTTRETFCMALAEAVTLGMPAIALDSIGNREYFNGSNYIFVKEQNEFVSKLELLFDIKLRKSLNEKSKLSMNRYTSEMMTKSFLKIVYS